MRLGNFKLERNWLRLCREAKDPWHLYELLITMYLGLTTYQLKSILKSEGLKVGGRKQELLERVADHDLDYLTGLKREEVA